MVPYSISGMLIIIVCGIAFTVTIVVVAWAMIEVTPKFSAVRPIPWDKRSQEDWRELSDAYFLVALMGLAIVLPGVVLFYWALPMTLCLGLVMFGAAVYLYGTSESDRFRRLESRTPQASIDAT